jgi:hypothetical protein
MTKEEFDKIKIGDILLRDTGEEGDAKFLCEIIGENNGGIIPYKVIKTLCSVSLQFLIKHNPYLRYCFKEYYHFYNKPKLKLKDFLND